jgi:hypothetical protein
MGTLSLKIDKLHISREQEESLGGLFHGADSIPLDHAIVVDGSRSRISLPEVPGMLRVHRLWEVPPGARPISLVNKDGDYFLNMGTG